MEEIKVGDYIRTDIGEIFVVDEITWHEKEGLYFYDSPKNCGGCWSDQVKIHSKNIIDLIEFGDYVNGAYVTHIATYTLNERTEKFLKLCGMGVYYTEKEIKNIVTKEQFENIEYKLEN